MATETVTTLECMARYNESYALLMSIFESSGMREQERASCQRYFIYFYRGLLTNSMMLSQTTADMHAFSQAFLHSYNMFDAVSWGVMEKVMERIVERGNYHHVSIFLDYLRRGLDSDDEDRIHAFILRGERALEGIYKNETCDGAFPSQHSQHALTVAVAAVLHLLAVVFQYLIGYIDRGGTKTYSSGCFDFRASFVSVLLFLAAFVWIKFRQPARPPTGIQPEHPIDDATARGYIYLRKNGSYEARYTIPVNMRDEAHPVKRPRLTLGEHELPEEAAFVWRVAETCYEDQRGTCCVTLQGKSYSFPVPAMSEHERGLVGEEKKKWVMKYAKDVGKKEYEEYAKQLALATFTGSNDPVPHQPRSVETVGEEQRMCDGNRVLQNVAFESAVGEQSESEQQTLVQQQQQPQAYDEEFVQDLEYQQVPESQNLGLQQVHTPSQQISDHLVAQEEPHEIISMLMETCSKQSEVNQGLLDLNDRLLEDIESLWGENERLRKEKELSDEEKERLRKQKELCEQEIERLRKEKELSDEEKERLRKEKELSDAVLGALT